ncbi:MAG: hypothetical protein IT423_09750, partial [Pirellulaceae bacterium]|nr:hypothetical protein [Pirellulaceae bacterium]
MAKRQLTREAKTRRPVRLCVGIAATDASLPALRTLLHALPAEAGLSVIVVLTISGEAAGDWGVEKRLERHEEALHLNGDTKHLHADSSNADAGSPKSTTATHWAAEEAVESAKQYLHETQCALPIEFVEQSTRLKPNCIYVAMESASLTVVGGLLQLATLPASGLPAPADHFLSSLAVDFLERSVGILLANSGTDGLLGLKAISDAGGMTIVERPEQGQGSLLSATRGNSSGIDHILPIDEIAIELTRYTAHIQEASDHDFDKQLNKQIIETIPAIADAVEKHTAHNFRHYKVTTLARRIKRRMQVLKQSSVTAYLDVVTASRDEAGRLFRDLLISVTSFFRDAEAFATLEQAVIPKLIAQQPEGETLRVWVAGCATGEEAYTMAIVLQEAIDAAGRHVPLQIFATDLDERALQTARQGSYPLSIAEELAPERLKRFFIKRGMRYLVNKQIRDCVVFSSHNLISDPPFTKLDLISCRNLLIYLGSHLQKKLIPLFHYALRPGGYLFLGPSESMSGHKELFRSISAKHRITQRKTTSIAPASPQGALRMTMARTSQAIGAERTQIDLHQLGYSENLPEWNYELFLKHVVPEQVEDVKRQFQSCYETEADWTL